MSKHVILKGTHRSVLSWMPIFHINKKRLNKTVKFYPDAAYDFGDIDQLDINKLFGLSYGMHHKNSARFGWRWDVEKKMIEILAYVYIDGVRVTQDVSDLHIGYVLPGVLYECDLEVNSGYYVFSINSSIYPEPKVVRIKHGKLTWWGYRLFPYFGGNRKAIRRVHIDLY